MNGRIFSNATVAQADRLARTLVAARVFPDEETLRAQHRDRPWIIQVNARGDVAVLDRWRDHLDLLGIEALWCPMRYIGDAIAQLSLCAMEHGFSGLVSPPVVSGDVPAYEAAGMRVREMLAVLELTPVSPADVPERPDVTIRPALMADAESVLGIDADCFEPFWRYDRRLMQRFLDVSAVAVAERDGRCVGYTLTTVDRGSAVLGRLCVCASERRTGIGSLLLEAAVVRARESGARHMTLSARTGNAAALALYRSAGFTDTGRRYAFLTTGDETRRGQGHRNGSLMGC
jgi:ribosomal-protein-alanine N-acetyltransferase